MTAKKPVADNRTFVLLDGHGDPVAFGGKALLLEVVEDITDYDGADAIDGWRVYEVGAEVALSAESKVEVYIG